MLCEIASGLDPYRYEVQIALTLGKTILRWPADHVPVVLLPDQVPMDFVSSIWMRRLQKNFALLMLLFIGRWPMEPNSQFKELASAVSVFRTMSGVLGRYILAWRPDCIVSFLPNSNMLTLLAKAWYKFPTPVVCSDRNHLSSELTRLPWPQLRRRFIRRFYRNAAAHIAVAPDVANDLHNNFDVPPELIQTIINGVDIARLKQLADAPAPYMRNSTTLRLLSVGRLNQQKGFDILLRAMGRIRHLPWQLTILGQGEEEDTLRKLSAQEGITDRIEFPGWQANPYPWMKHSDLFVLSSRWEGMPNVLLEAMAIGLPTVATDCPTGPRLLLDNGRVGRLVETGSESRLAEAIASLLVAPDERRRLATLAIEHCKQYTTDAMIDAYRTLIDKVIAGPSQNEFSSLH